MRLMSSLIFVAALAITAACSGSGSQFVPPTATATPQLLAQATATSNPTAQPSATQSFLLEITSPHNESVLNTPSVTVRGRSTADAVVSVNGQLADVGADGSFESFIALDPGPNTIEIVANDFSGGKNSRLLTVIYVP